MPKIKSYMDGFSAAYDMLPAGIQRSVRDELMDRCGWATDSGTTSTFHLKCRGRMPIRKLEAEAVRVIFAKYGLDADTGERIN